ncbi:MAG: formylmethanofuran--tetrahydromethanopterin N-formyltransferase [Thermoproteota archaeon]
MDEGQNMSGKDGIELIGRDDGSGELIVRNRKTGNILRIVDTFSEMFPMWLGRILITAVNERWALTAAQAATGFASSIIASPAEAAIEKSIPPSETPDKRPGYIIQIYHRSRTNLRGQMTMRLGQCVLTCPTTSAFNALQNAKRKAKIGKSLSQFGDGYSEKTLLFGREVWRIPVMEGEFIVEETFGIKKGIAGGMFLIMAKSSEAGLRASEEAVKAARTVEGVALPFPGGVCRSGSKVGSRKFKLGASTNEPFCPTLRDKVEGSSVPEEVSSVYEIVINGINQDCIREAMARGIEAATQVDGIIKITSSNYGGKLGPYKLQLRELINA